MTHVCEYAGKVSFSSVGAARKSLSGQLKSKRIRVYPCPDNPAHWHLTKEGTTHLNHGYHDRHKYGK